MLHQGLNEAEVVHGHISVHLCETEEKERKEKVHDLSDQLAKRKKTLEKECLLVRRKDGVEY